MGAGASAQPLVPPPTEPKETADKNDDSLTSVHDARLAALLRGAGTTKLTYSDSAFEALLARNLPSPLEWPPASETRRRRKTLDRLQELFGKASLSSRQAAQTVAQLMPDDDERDAVAEFLLGRVDASARPAYVTALSRCEPPLAADLLERLGKEEALGRDQPLLAARLGEHQHRRLVVDVDRVLDAALGGLLVRAREDGRLAALDAQRARRLVE